MKYILTTILLFSLLFSCKKEKPDIENPDILDTSIFNQIKSHYVYNNKETNIIEQKSDSITNINIQQHSGGDDGYYMTIMSVSIPTKGDFGIYYSDFNGDNIDDTLVAVNTEGGYGGGNVWWVDYFIFLKNNDQHKLVTIKSNWDINNCSGFFNLKKIEKNILLGTSSCYTKEDGRCCPSLKFNTQIQFSDNKFSVISNNPSNKD